MRFFRLTAWRAVHGLEGLEPARAKLFVKRAKREGQRRAVRWALVTVAALTAFMAAFILAGPIAYALRTEPGWMLDHVPFPQWLLFCGLLLAPMIGGWAMQRWLVIRSVRLSLFTRGVCGKCKTALMGRPVGDDGTVACAGCDRVHEPEPAWDEVGLREGAPVFRPAANWRRPSAWTRWIAPIAVLLAVMVFPLVVAVAFFEYSLWRDARAARTERTGYAPLATMAGALQPTGSSPGDANAWDHIEGAMKLKEKVDAAVWDSPEAREAAGRAWTPPEFIHHGDPYNHQAGYDGEAQFKAAVTLAEEMIEPYRKEEVFAEIDVAAAQPRWELVWSGDPRMPVMGVYFPQLKMARELAKVNRVRARTAAARGDLHEFEAALGTSTFLAEVCAENGGALPGLVSIAIESYGLREVRTVLSRRPTKEWVDACERGLRPRRPRPGPVFFFETERVAALDTVSYAFAQPAAIRSRAFEGLTGDPKGQHPRVGFYRENLRIVERTFDGLIAASKVDRPHRPKVRLDGDGLYFSGIVLGTMDKMMVTLDQIATDRDGLSVMIALERYRIEHGAYPERLESLVPSLLSAVPLDPWSGLALCYRLGGGDGTATDPQGWGYRLWSVGADGFDNGGKMIEAAEDRYRPFSSDKFGGYDFIINDNER